MNTTRGLNFKWFEYEVEVINIERKELKDIAFCSYITKCAPLWHSGILLCRCYDFLDLRTVAKKFITEKKIIMEQVCYTNMNEYKKGLLINEESILITTPIVKAYGVYKALAELLAMR
ncbi:MAG: hypothetical protein QW701_00240 [Candidatus Nezhaarchaeales archaeon]